MNHTGEGMNGRGIAINHLKLSEASDLVAYIAFIGI